MSRIEAIGLIDVRSPGLTVLRPGPREMQYLDSQKSQTKKMSG